MNPATYTPAPVLSRTLTSVGCRQRTARYRAKRAVRLCGCLFACGAGALPAAPASAQATAVQILVQSSPLAGFRHYEAPHLWQELRRGDALTLVREPTNPYDANAVRVEWRGLKLGYIPRAQNAAVARQMDGGAALQARVSKLEHTRAPNRRIEFEVYLPL